MNRRIIGLRKIFSAALLGAVIFLSLLPSLGARWHSVLPEHEHWILGNASTGLHREVIAERVSILDECPECDPVSPDAAILHVANPMGAIPILAMVAAATAVFFLFILPESSRLWHLQPLPIASPDLPRLDPPPRTR